MTSADVTAAARPTSAAATNGDPDAFEAAVRPHYAPLIRRLVLVLGDPHDAEDVAQDAYLSAFRSWDRFDGTDVRAWLYTIGLRLAFNHRRGRRRWLAAIGRIEPRPWTDPSDPDLWAALATLDQSTRSALLAQRAGRVHAGRDRRDAVGAGGDGRELDLAWSIGPATGARSGPLSGRSCLPAGVRGGTERLPGGAPGAPQPPGHEDRVTTLIIASGTARPTCPSPANRAGEVLLGVGKIGAAVVVPAVGGRQSQTRPQPSSRRMR